MSPQSRRHWQMMGTIGVAIIALAIFNLAVSRSEIDLSPIQGDIQFTPPAASKSGEAKVGQDDLSLEQTLARPLFSPTRRDYVADELPMETTADVVEETVPQADRPASQLVLQGTRMIAGVRSALVAVPEQEGKWVSVGDMVEGWSVAEIEAERLLISRGDERIAVTLYPAVGAQN